MTRQVYENSMIAHIWANESQESARSHNGQFYFEGPRIYSYGSHFVAGLIARNKAGQRYVFVTGRRYSVTTSKHIGYVWRALPLLNGVTVPVLTEFDSDIRYAGHRLTATEKAKAIRAAIVKQYTLGLYGDALTQVCAAFDLSRSLNAIQKEGAAILAKKAKEEKAKKAALSLRSATLYADMTDREFQARIMYYADWSNVSRLANFATDLFRMHRDTKGKLGKRATAMLAARIKQARAAKGEWEALRARKHGRDNAKRAIKVIRQVNAAIEIHIPIETRAGFLDSMPKYQLQQLSESLLQVAGKLRPVSRTLAIERAAQCESLIAEIERQQAAERFAREQAARVAWLSGETGMSYTRFSDEWGGALCRVIGDELQTSHGARVPLGHAVKVFQFVKLCKEQGRNWTRNGTTIRVGHFHVDSVSAPGDFVAGCHKFHWPEIERVARVAGLFETVASEAALESTYAGA